MNNHVSKLGMEHTQNFLFNEIRKLRWLDLVFGFLFIFLRNVPCNSAILVKSMISQTNKLFFKKNKLGK